MSDTIHRTIPQAWCDPNEPGVAAHYTFPHGEIARYGMWKNHHALYGNVYDLTAPIGNPLFAENFGIEVRDDAASYWRGATVTQGVGLVADVEVGAAPAAARVFVSNGGEHQLRINAGGTISLSLDNGVTWSTSAYSVVGRGRCHVVGRHDGTNQILDINRRQADTDAAVLAVPAGGNLDVGQHGQIRRVVVPSAWSIPGAARYLREFARELVWLWKPVRVGEGPVGGILTGAVGEGGWSCPLGGATLGFVWMPNLSLPAGGELALTDTVPGTLRRIEFLNRRPAFGSWLLTYRVRDPATDDLRFALTSDRGVDFTAAGSNSYWVRAWLAPGPWCRTSVYLANGPTIIDVDLPFATPVAGDLCAMLITRHPNGDWDVWSYREGSGWFWRNAVGNDVTVLTENGYAVCPGGTYVTGVAAWQGEMTPHELGLLP